MCKNTQERSRRICKLDGSHFGLALSYFVNPESCGNPNHFHDYLWMDALTDYKSGMGVTYIMLEEDSGIPTAILGFVTLKTSSLIIKSERGFEGNPAIEIAELSVANGAERTGVGTALCYFAIDKAMEIKTQHVGVKYLLVCSEPKSVDFYKKCHFGRTDDQYTVPREGWNHDCVPMMMKLPEEY